MNLKQVAVDWVVLTAILTAMLAPYAAMGGAPLTLQTAGGVVVAGGVTSIIGAVLFKRERENDGEVAS